MMHRKVIFTLAALLLITSLVMACAQTAQTPTSAKTTTPAQSPASASRQISLIAVGSSSGSEAFSWTTTMALLVQKHSSRIRMDVIPSKGFVENMHFLLENKGQFGPGFEWILNDARKGTGAFTDLGPKDDLRILYSMTINACNIVVLDNSPIKAFTLEEIKGKKIAAREIGSAGIMFAQVALSSLGIDPKKDVKLMPMNQTDCNSALIDGTADIMLALMAPGHPQMQDLSVTKKIRFIDVPTGVLEACAKNLGTFSSELKAGTYKGQDKAVITPYMGSYFYVRKDLPDDVATELLDLWWGYADERSAVLASIKEYGTPEQLQKQVGAALTALHPAASKYYRDKGWIK